MEAPAPSPISPRDHAAITQLVQRATALQNDPHALPDLHTADTIIVNVAGRRVSGREAFRDAMTGALNTALAHVRTDVEIDDLHAVTENVVIVSCTKTIHDDRRATDRDEPLPTASTMTYVMSRHADGWQIALAQTTPRR